MEYFPARLSVSQTAAWIEHVLYRTTRECWRAAR
jgi:hypothetical protein